MNGLGLDDESRDIITLHDGTVLETHGPAVCAPDEFCCIHKPSQHPLRDAPMTWMRTVNIMLRVCEHGSVHPDPDALAFQATRTGMYLGWHPCCPSRCCGLPDIEL